MLRTIKGKYVNETDNLTETYYSEAYERLPAYYRLQKTIEQEITSGAKKPGDMIPSERDYAQQYGISVGTVRKALGILVQDGFLERIRGRGSFIRSRAIQNEALRYYRYVKDFDSTHQSLRIKSLGTTLLKKAPDICEILHIDPETSLTCLKRLFSLGKEPMVFSVSYFSNSLFPKIHTLPADVFENQTLYMAVEKLFGLPTKEVKEYFCAVSADDDVSSHLQIPKGSPALCIHMRAISFQNAIYEYRQSYCNTQSYYLLRDRGLF